MNVSLARLSLSAIATFTPSATGAQREQKLGWDGLTAELPAAVDAPHVIRLSVTNFGTAGATITIDADSLQVALGTGAVATVSDGDGVNYDGVLIELGSVYAVGLRVISGPDDDVGITLGATEFKLIATTASFGITAVRDANLIDGAGTWTITGPTGVQTPWIIEILVFASAA